MSKILTCVAFVFLAACSTLQTPQSPVKVTATELVTGTGSEPRQFLVNIEDSGHKWPKMVTLEGKVATAFVGYSGDHGRSVEVTCQGKWASVAVVDHNGAGNQELVCRFNSPIQGAQ